MNLTLPSCWVYVELDLNIFKTEKQPHHITKELCAFIIIQSRSFLFFFLKKRKTCALYRTVCVCRSEMCSPTHRVIIIISCIHVTCAAAVAPPRHVLMHHPNVNYLNRGVNTPRLSAILHDSPRRLAMDTQSEKKNIINIIATFSVDRPFEIKTDLSYWPDEMRNRD
jgi:hypothetical protein